MKAARRCSLPARRSPLNEHGRVAWEKVGDHTYKSLGVAFLFNAQGFFDGSQKIAKYLAAEYQRGRADRDDGERVVQHVRRICPPCLRNRRGNRNSTSSSPSMARERDLRARSG